MAEELSIRSGDGLTHITLNRPEKRNALSPKMVDAMLAALSEAASNGTRLLAIQGAGKAFCAGFDFTGIENQSDADLVYRFVRVEQMLQAIRHAPFATLALVQGACFGAGADIVVACGRRVAATGTSFRMPGLRFGVVLGTRRLAALVGGDGARSLLETSRIFSAKEAKELGFLTQIADEDKWPETVNNALGAALALPVAAQRTLLDVTISDTRTADMVELVRSVAEPGLRDRITEFLKQAKREN